MEKTELDQIRFCAFCPNICRIFYPTSGISQKESLTPSALAYLGYAIVNGYLSYTREVHMLLDKTKGAKQCGEACPYAYDIAGNLQRLREEYDPI
jgi:hypothetical protein